MVSSETINQSTNKAGKEQNNMLFNIIALVNKPEVYAEPVKHVEFIPVTNKQYFPGTAIITDAHGKTRTTNAERIVEAEPTKKIFKYLDTKKKKKNPYYKGE